MTLKWLFPELAISYLQCIKLRMCSQNKFIFLSWMNIVFMLSIGKFILLVVTACHQSHCMWMKLQHIFIGPWYHCILFCQDLKHKCIHLLKLSYEAIVTIIIILDFRNMMCYDQLWYTIWLTSILHSNQRTLISYHCSSNMNRLLWASCSWVTIL